MILDKEEIEFIDNLYQQINSLDQRVTDTEVNERKRNSYQRDYARILYSSSFRRLQGKMQIIGIHHDKFIRNRLTHSLEVGQIARAIAGNLRRALKSSGIQLYGQDMYVIDSSALCHDIGHPPFGHYGERVLNNLSEDVSFEGNAQSIRVLTTLEKKEPNIKGLNLTYRTLLSIAKYIYPESSNKKKFIYNEDFDLLTTYASENKIDLRTLDVQIIDIADEIAYAAHDIEDSLNLSLFTIDELLEELYIWFNNKQTDEVKKFEEIIKNSKKYAKCGSQYDSSEEFSFLFKKELTSKIVDTLIKDIGVVDVDDKQKEKTNTSHTKELGFKKYKSLSEGLKKVTFKCLNRSDLIHLYEKKGDKILNGLFKVYNSDENKENKLLPPEYRPRNGENRQRLIVDYIAGMMDSFAESTYKKYFGPNSLNELY